MPIPKLHLTALEITHSLPSQDDITAIVTKLGPEIAEAMTDLPFTSRARLIKPMLSYDGAAIALSFLPAAGESLPTDRSKADDAFTYHHLRRDLFGLATTTGVAIESRYIVPSSHITVGRFLIQEDHDTKEKMRHWVMAIEEINQWLEVEFWPRDGQPQEKVQRGEWIVGQEKGLEFREGTLWYGDGEMIRLGKGF